MCRWGSKLINDGYINFYQFIVSFLGVYFSGQATSQLFVFAGSESHQHPDVMASTNHIALEDFTSGHKAANYYFWISALEPTIQETPENSGKGPEDRCKSFDLENVQFAYPLVPQNRVLKGISLSVSPATFPSSKYKVTLTTLKL